MDPNQSNAQAAQPQPNAQIPQQPVQPPVQQQPLPQNSNKKKLFIIGAIIVVLVILIGIGFVFFQNKKADNTIKNKPSVTIVPTVVTVSPTLPIQNENTIDLRKGVKTKIPGTTISLNYYQDSSIPENCPDCIATTIIKIYQGGKEDELDYTCGGVAGQCTTKLEKLGYSVEVLKVIDKDTIEVKVLKQ